MVVVRHHRKRAFTVVGGTDVDDASATSKPSSTAPIDELFEDPEVCRRIGDLIARAASKKSKTSEASD